ncbi:lamin tail domain-containing protein [Acaryochloris marina]|uniref:lamin tail domain-containing protein n=1 Tax=Acaryochloris marina TaxID=155978 RepID=UPI00164F733E|nr:lamin tail domain-containing protein [Acaryochloris marina]
MFSDFVFADGCALAEELKVVTFNVESGNDTDPNMVARDMQAIPDVDLWGLSEVENQSAADTFLQAAGDSNFESILGTSGGSDRLQIIYDKSKLNKLNSSPMELTGIGGDRKPLVEEFEVISDNTKFLFAVNHFNRGSARKRQEQARKFRDWAGRQTLPVVAVGDYNFDFDISAMDGNPAFEIFFEEPVFSWARQTCLSSNTCPSTGTQCNECFDGLLDFIFLSGDAKKWSNQSEILFKGSSFCDNDPTGASDHFPVQAIIDLDGDFQPFQPNILKGPHIASLLPNPSGRDDTNESVTLVNTGTEAINLVNWILRDKDGNTLKLDELDTLFPRERKNILRDGRDLSLNNSCDTVELVDPAGEIVDSVSYIRPEEGEELEFIF